MREGRENSRRDEARSIQVSRRQARPESEYEGRERERGRGRGRVWNRMREEDRGGREGEVRRKEVRLERRVVVVNEQLRPCGNVLLARAAGAAEKKKKCTH